MVNFPFLGYSLSFFLRDKITVIPIIKQFDVTNLIWLNFVHWNSNYTEYSSVTILLGKNVLYCYLQPVVYENRAVLSRCML